MLQRILVASATATTQGTSPGGQCQIGVLMVAAVRFSGTTLEGAGADAKAIITFDNAGEKRLLLKFAKVRAV